jgi:uncharacterized protein YdeI (BOF family)
MKKLIGVFVVAMVLGVGLAGLSYAAADMAAPGLQTIKGDLLKIEGDAYVVKDMAGKEIRLHVDKTTELEGSFKAGDKSITKPLVEDARIPGPQTVTGDVLKMDGDFYVIRDMTGKEIRLHVDKTTTLEGSFKAGDKIEARATEQDHALSIKHAQPPKM